MGHEGERIWLLLEQRPKAANPRSFLWRQRVFDGRGHSVSTRPDRIFIARQRKPSCHSGLTFPGPGMGVGGGRGQRSFLAPFGLRASRRRSRMPASTNATVKATKAECPERAGRRGIGLGCTLARSPGWLVAAARRQEQQVAPECASSQQRPSILKVDTGEAANARSGLNFFMSSSPFGCVVADESILRMGRLAVKPRKRNAPGCPEASCWQLCRAGFRVWTPAASPCSLSLLASTTA